MAGGPLYGEWYPVTGGNCFFWAMSESSGSQWMGLGVAASIAADSTWRGAFILPQVLPSGTPKLRLFLRANAASGSVKVNPKWTFVSDGENFGTPSPTPAAEGTTTVTWATGDEYDLKVVDIPLDINDWTGAEGLVVKMNLVFEAAGWSMLTPVWCKPVLVWV